ncbi:cobalt ECF transporter T component CbiQ [Brevibacillus borstelensis]|uniref:cobalt ECF transporter T component CbiQ n=1 Tax=Brevibacillus borstelensis TaxID=45462 RepID=UPI000F07F645|nr:cobalt ECF transporter T component CbiQ [Brevibacillus borstelensis]MED1883268.1 cobalt ECF transporter T component CbiQ [Brevibacillus borstelensis]RNB65718.1 cobalt ECF transporter T component CbiQ [Brevibacillus borstelensis]GED53890.1 cobalt ECF transporter T component CbiQ [Brevibacillus borstelensis]
MIGRIDSLAYENRLKRLPPEQKLLFSLAMLLLALISHPLVQGILFVWMSVWIVVYARTPWRIYFVVVAASVAFLLAGSPALLLEASRLAEWTRDDNAIASWQLGSWVVYVTAEGLSRVMSLAARSLAALSCFSFILFTVPFAEVLQVFRRIGIPSILTDLMMIMYRFVFVLLETAEQIWTAQKARGGHRGTAGTLKDAGRLIVQLFIRTMARYRQMYISMTARGFTDDFRVLVHASHMRSKRYEWEAVAGCLLLAMLEWWMGG